MSSSYLFRIDRVFVAKSRFIMVSDNDQINRLAKIHEIYVELYKFLEDTSFTQGIPTMLAAGIAFFYTFFSFFITAKVVLFNQTEFKDEAICCALWWIFSNIYIQMIIAGNEFLKYGSGFIIKELREVLKRSKKDVKISATMSFSNFITFYPLKFTCRLFDLDLKFIFAVNLY